MPSSYKIIKNRNLDIRDEAEIPVKDHVEYVAHNLGRQADSLLKIAKDEASKVMADIEAMKVRIREEIRQEEEPHLSALRDQARQEGYHAGLEEGLIEGRRQGLDEIRTEQQHVLDEAKVRVEESLEERKAIIGGVQSEIVELSVKIAQELLNKSLEIDDNIIIAIAEKALMEVSQAQYITLRVSGKSRMAIQQHLEQLKAQCPGSRLTLVTDNLLGDGDCVLETATQIIEATLDGQLANIRKALCEVIRTP